MEQRSIPASRTPDGEGFTFYVALTLKDLAAQVGCDDGRVTRSFKDLQDAGLAVTVLKGFTGTSSKYVFSIPPSGGLPSPIALQGWVPWDFDDMTVEERASYLKPMIDRVPMPLTDMDQVLQHQDDHATTALVLQDFDLV